MFKKILIANRGAIACRVMRTLRRLNVASIAVYTEADHLSRHVDESDEAYCIGNGAVAESYLDINKILAIFKKKVKINVLRFIHFCRYIDGLSD